MARDTPHILLAEDDADLSELIAAFLGTNGFEVRVVADGERAVEAVLASPPLLLILDIMLPGIDGYTVCERLRGRYAGPILMLTARGEDSDELSGFAAGADDYLRKPVRPKVLLARINALLKRFGTTRSSKDERIERALIPGQLVIDLRRHSVTLDGDAVDLTAAEFQLLLYLAQNAGHVLTRDDIYQQVRGIPYNGLDRSIDLRISRLRRKLGDDSAAPEVIKAIRGVGYIFVERP